MNYEEGNRNRGHYNVPWGVTVANNGSKHHHTGAKSYVVKIHCLTLKTINNTILKASNRIIQNFLTISDNRIPLMF